MLFHLPAVFIFRLLWYPYVNRSVEAMPIENKGLPSLPNIHVFSGAKITGLRSFVNSVANMSLSFPVEIAIAIWPYVNVEEMERLFYVKT